MSEASKKNLREQGSDPDFIVINPKKFEKEKLRQATALVFSNPITDENVESVSECIASTDAPVFCREQDLDKLLNEGFENYRFNVLKGYCEVKLQKARLVFYPVHSKIKIRSWGFLFSKNKKAPDRYNVLIEFDHGHRVLYLSSTEIGSPEKELLTNKDIEIITSNDQGAAYWSQKKALSLVKTTDHIKL